MEKIPLKTDASYYLQKLRAVQKNTAREINQSQRAY